MSQTGNTNANAQAGAEVDQNEKLEIDGQELSLADLAGFDMSGVEAKKFENLPEGFYSFEITADPAPQIKVNKKVGMTMIPMKVLNVISLKNPGEVKDPSKLIGQSHYEMNRLTTSDSFGYLMATLEGLQAPKGKLNDMLKSLVGTKFDANITHRVNKDNTDIVYASAKRITNVVKPAAASV